MFRRDTRLTGRSPVKGDIKTPVICEKLFAGAYEGLLVARPDAKVASLTLDPREILASDYWTKHASEWNTDGAFAETSQGGFSGTAGGYVKMIPDLDCPQKVWFEDAFSGGKTQRGYLYAYDQPDGKERVVWQTEPEIDMYLPTVLVLDADADGRLEAVVATHYRVMIFDGQTGAKKMELRWHGMRNYGFFGAFTMPGEKYPKFVVIADFISHLDVLDNDGKNLSVLWRKDLESTIMRKDKITRPGPNPIADLDGDQRPEITFNFFNDKGDQQWHVTSYDAVTGEVRYDVPKAFLHGIADVDGDGVSELLVQDTRGLAIPHFGPISLFSHKNGEPKILWSHERGCWQTTELSRLPLTSNTSAAGGKRGIMLAGKPDSRTLFAVVPKDGGRESLLCIERDSRGKWGSRSAITGPAGAKLSLKAVRDGKLGPEYLVAWRSNGDRPQKFHAKAAALEAASWREAAGPTPVPIVVNSAGKAKPTLIFQDGTEHIAAYSKVGSDWELRWRLAGRGMTFGEPLYFGVMAADVDGDGGAEVLFAAPASSGEADLVAVDISGKEKWRHTFKGFDGVAPIWNLSGLTFWTVGHFTSPDHLDVFANPRRSTMHSYEGHGLNGRTGRAIWRRTAVFLDNKRKREESRGYGGRIIATADVDGDGLDEIICENPDRFFIASGKDGGIRKVVSTASGTFPSMWVAYAMPVLADFQGTGGLQALWGGCGYITALLSIDGTPIWYGGYSDGTLALQGIAKADETGKLLIGGAGYKDGFRCFDPADGKVLWTYPLPGSGSSGDTISADVDSDGLEEFVFAHGKTLYALNGKGGKANVVWSIELPANPGPLAYADADGDGKPEIVAGASDGYVYIVGDTGK